jgi:exodeoxyribonuclease VII small subunit
MASHPTPTGAPPQPASASAASAASFEAAISELESLVQSLEGGQLSLEDALANYQRGAELIRYCQQTLGAAEQKIQVLEDGLLQDFTPQSPNEPASNAD